MKLKGSPYRDTRWAAVRILVLERDGHVCQVRRHGCLVAATEADHIVPWAEGGAWFELSNLRAACKPCNSGRARSRLTALTESYQRAAEAPPPSRQWF